LAPIGDLRTACRKVVDVSLTTVQIRVLS